MKFLKHNLKYFLKQYFEPIHSQLCDLNLLMVRDVNFYKHFQDILPPNLIFFDVTNICNAKCTFCAYTKAIDPKGTMPFDIFKKSVDDYVSISDKDISFTPTIGDPLIDPGLLEKIDYAVNSSGANKVYLYTNGIMLTKNMLYKHLIESGIYGINISTAGTNKDIYEAVYQVPVYHKVIDGIHKLLAFNKEKGEPVNICLQFRLSTRPNAVLNSPDFNKYIKPFLSDKVTIDFNGTYDNWGGVITEDVFVGNMRLKKGMKIKRVPCDQTFEVSILLDGSVRLCGCRMKSTVFDDLVVGNIMNQTLKDIFYGKLTKAVRQRFLDGNLPEVCKDCSWYRPVTKESLYRRMKNQIR